MVTTNLGMLGFVALVGIGGAISSLWILVKAYKQVKNKQKIPLSDIWMFCLFILSFALASDYIVSNILFSLYANNNQTAMITKADLDYMPSEKMFHLILFIHLSLPVEASDFKKMIEFINSNKNASQVMIIWSALTKLYVGAAFPMLGAFFYSHFVEEHENKVQSSENLPSRAQRKKGFFKKFFSKRKIIHTDNKTVTNENTGKSEYI